MIKCPECHVTISLPPHMQLWDRFFCEACGVELEVVEQHPWELESVVDLDDDDGDDTRDEDTDWSST